jgi:signal transduction histidine kinase
VGSLTHALKGLLSGLEGGLYLVESGLRKENAERVQSGTDMLQRNLGRARSLVGNTLYYARDREVHWEEMTSREVISECASTFARLAEQKGVALEATATAGGLQGDRFGVQALLANLVENALEACGKEGGAAGGHVSLLARSEPPWMVFEVAHDGRPMDPATRAGALGTVYAPSGADRAGLWIHAAWRIAAAHGGSLSAEPATPSGERFIARLPTGGPDTPANHCQEGGRGAI